MFIRPALNVSRHRPQFSVHPPAVCLRSRSFIIMPCGLPSGQYLGFLEYFNKISVNGRVGRNELRAILERAGRDPSDEEITQIIDNVSVASDGIDFQAFINYVRSYQQLRNVESEYREAFRIYDRSGTGKLSQEDIEYVFRKLRVNVDVPALFKVADVDNSGTIEYNEFVDIMNKSFQKSTGN